MLLAFINYQSIIHQYNRRHECRPHSGLLGTVHYQCILALILQTQFDHSMFQDLTTLVLDIGTFQSRIGYGGDEAPKVVAPSFVASPAAMEESERKILAGKKYLSLDKTDLQIESIFRPKPEGEAPQIHEPNYSQFVEFLLTDQLRVNLKDYSLLFSEDINFSQGELLAQRETIANIAFQKLGVSNIFFLKTPVLSCFATGRSTALVVDSGDSSTRVTVVHDGFVLNKTAKIVPYGGKTLSHEFERLIRAKTGKNVQTRFHLTGAHYTRSFLEFQTRDVLSDIKRSFSIGSTEQGSEASQRIQYELPDKSVITLDRSEIADIFINPPEELAKEYGKYEYRGVPNMIVDTINGCDVDIKKELYSNILLTGGNTLFNGQSFVNNILNKVSSSAPPNAKVKPVSVCQHSERQYLSWIGGSIVTSLSAFQSYWIGKEEYQAVGPSILDRKCT